MTSVILYFQVHQPYRLRPDFNYFAIGTGQDFEDNDQNIRILRRITERCYLKANHTVLSLIDRHKGAFRVAYSLSGTFLEQCERWAPEVLRSFRQLHDTGCVEFLAETYYHSLAGVYSEREWRRQVGLHTKKLDECLGAKPTVFRNTELIYNNEIARWAENIGFRGILTEGLDRVLGWRNTQYAYRPQGCESIKVLFRNYRLSDDIAFRFKSPSLPGGLLTASTYAGWLAQAAEHGETLNIFLDYETFGEHHREQDGIFAFLNDLPSQVLASGKLHFETPTQVVARLTCKDTIDIPAFISWADQERDLTAWLGNHLQRAAASSLYQLEETLWDLGDPDLLHMWSKLQTSDHFYYMSTKGSDDGNVHRYFSPFKSPYDAFITYTNALNELRLRVDHALESRLHKDHPTRRAATLTLNPDGRSRTPEGSSQSVERPGSPTDERRPKPAGVPGSRAS